MSNAILYVDSVSFRWPGHMEFSISIPSLEVAAGETVLVLGESGSGKSTLLSLICGTLRPDEGRVWIAGTDTSKLSGGRKDRFRAENVGVIFQQFNLLPFGSVGDNVLLPLRFAPKRRARIEDESAQAAALCQTLGLPSGICSARANTLSVGQQQRVAVARALVGQPPIIVADEPTSALDENSQAAFLDLLFQQTNVNKTALLMVSHDPRLSSRFDRVVRMKDIARIERVVT